MTWQPIETAPKDGTHVLLWEEYSTDPFVGYWLYGKWSASHEHVDAEGGWDGATVIDNIQCDVTHWMPLPPPPSSDAAPQAAPAVDKRAEAALLQVLAAVQRYLPPDGPSEKDTLSEIIGIVDPWPLDTLEKS
jgi:hypothetical protein